LRDHISAGMQVCPPRLARPH